MNAYFEVKNLTKKYKKVLGIKDVTFSCNEGDFIVILGPSGAGKTTTVKIIAGVVDQTEGDVCLKGKCINSVEPQKRNISMVFEDYALYPHISVFENIASPLRIRNFSENEIKKKVESIAELVGIEKHLDKLPSQISGGQKQRTGLARCLIRDADIYILDEPIAHLDAKLRHRMRGEFKRIHKELGKTMIYVTHDFREALSLADKVIILDKGYIKQIGTAMEVFNKPVDTFVATLFGEPPMNLINFSSAVINNGILELKAKDSESSFFKNFPMKDAVLPEVQLGFRHFTVSLSSEKRDNTLKGKVYVYEIIEGKKAYTISVGGDLVKVLTNRSTDFKLNQEIYITLDPKSIYLFDKKTSLRIKTR